MSGLLRVQAALRLACAGAHLLHCKRRTCRVLDFKAVLQEPVPGCLHVVG